MHKKFALYFLSHVYSESLNEELTETSSLKENEQSPKLLRDTVANYVLGVVRNSARQMPELIDYFAQNYPQMTVKTSLLLNSKEINTLKISEYQKHVHASYVNGTYRYGPLLQTSIVGIKNEEIGDYFPQFIEDYLESNPFLEPVMPWGSFSVNENMPPQRSNDGPIIWARPGEQLIPTTGLKLEQQNLLNTNCNADNTSSGGGVDACGSPNCVGDNKKKRSGQIFMTFLWFNWV